MNTPKGTRIIIFLFIGILLVNFVSATDVAYIVTSANQANSEFISVLDELDLNYSLILSSNATNTNFSEYKMILLNNENFPNPQEIPINDVPSIIVNGGHLKTWGWAKLPSTAGSSNHFFIDIKNRNYNITDNLPDNFKVYNSYKPTLDYIQEKYLYGGIQTIASVDSLPSNTVIGLIEGGTNLTSKGVLKTKVNANSIFFGIYNTKYWTNATKQLFMNSLLWVAGDSTFNIGIKKGQNLVSFPLININLSEILSENPEIIFIKEYNNGFVEATQVANSKGYFIDASSDFVLTITGAEPKQAQSVLLNQGMNLIGINSLSNMSLSALPNEVIEVAKRNSDGGYSISTKYNSSWFNSFEIEPGKGYWFKTEIGEVTWDYNP